MLAQDPRYAEKAARVSALARDIAEVLPSACRHCKSGWQNAPRAPGQSNRARRGAPALHATARPKAAGHPGAAAAGTGLRHYRRRSSDNHLCCGSAGTYSVLEPELAQRLRDRKLGQLRALKRELHRLGQYRLYSASAKRHAPARAPLDRNPGRSAGELAVPAPFLPFGEPRPFESRLIILFNYLIINYKYLKFHEIV
jgi:hypothetical protein